MRHLPYKAKRASHGIWRLLMIAVAFAVMCPAVAQNNPYKIDDGLYALYTQVYPLRFKSEGLKLADRMYREAELKNDRKAQCLALTIPMFYYFQMRRNAEFERAVDRLLDFSLKYGYEQYYYFGASYRMSRMINEFREDEALAYVEGLIDFARKQGHVYGIYSGFNNMGQIHYSRREYGLAINAWRQAADIVSDHLPDQDLSQAYRKIAEGYEQLYRYNDMLAWAQRGLPHAKTSTARRRLMYDICVAEYMLGRRADFMAHYDQYINVEKLRTDSKNINDITLIFLNAICRGDTATAAAMFEKIPDTKSLSIRKIQLGIEYCMFDGNYERAATNQRWLYEGQIMTLDSVRRNSTLAMNARIANVHLDYEHRQLAMEHQLLANERQQADIAHARLQLANTQLTLRNSSLELARVRSRDDLMRLSYNRKLLEADRLRGRIEASRARHAYNDTLLASGGAVGFILLAALGMYLYNRRKFMQRLRTANASLEHNHSQLVAERDKAEAANRAKTSFIQNMDDDIRRPLDEVVSIARLIANADRSVTPAQLADMNRRLQAETGNMLAIVGDVISKTAAPQA